MKKTIVVTGAAGFIGSNVVKAIRGVHDCIPVDPDLERGSGMLSPDELLAWLEMSHSKPSVIIHLGACSDTTETNWDFLEENNVEYSKKLYRWCARNNCRFIYASSAAVYGDGKLGFDDSDPTCTLMHPLNLYAESKKRFDEWVEFRDRWSLPSPRQVVGLRFFNVFGPGESHKGRMASMAYHAWKQLKATGTVKLFEPGTQQRDFVYIDDVVRWIMQIVDRPEVNGIFNMGTGKAETFEKLAMCFKVLMCQYPGEKFIKYIPIPADLEGRYQAFTEAKMDKLRALGIATDPTPLHVACEKYVRWLEENEK